MGNQIDAPAATTEPPRIGDTTPENVGTVPPAADPKPDNKRTILDDLAAERKRRQTLEAKLAELQTATLSESEKALAAARSEGVKSVLDTANRRLITGAVMAQAATLGLIDPDAAARLVSLDDISVTETGEITGVEAALQSLIGQRPWLARQEPSAAPIPKIDAGVQGDKRASQKTNDDLARMSASEIVAALNAGTLDSLIGKT